MLRVIIAAFAVYMLAGCGGFGNEPVTPVVPDDNQPVLQGSSSKRFILFEAKLCFDPQITELSLIPVRNVSAHFDVTDKLLPPYCEDCITIEILEYKPIEKYIKLKIALRNPTQFTVYDVRSIIINHDNDFRLLNADSYADANPPSYQNKIGPFKAYATDWPKRTFAPGTAHARIYEMRFGSLSFLQNAELIVDACWPGNCEEPYQISNLHATGVFLDYETQDIQCEIYSWDNCIDYVLIDLGKLGLSSSYQMEHENGNLWVAKDVGWVYGYFGPGDYRSQLRAKCDSSDYFLYNYLDITIDASPPTVGWGRTWGGSKTDLACEVAADGSGNIFVAGQFGGTVDFDPGPDEESHQAANHSDTFLCGFNTEGEFQGARTWSARSVGKIAIDDEGSVYVMGRYSDTVDFDPGPGVDEHTAVSYDNYLCKFDVGLEYQWCLTWGNEYDDRCYSLAIDDSNNIYAAGYFKAGIDLDPGPEVDYKTSEEGDVYVSRFDPDGNYSGAFHWGNNNDLAYIEICTDSDGHIYIAGQYGGTVDFDPGPPVVEYSSEKKEVFLGKYSGQGELQWVHVWGAARANGVAVDSEDSVYITGYYQGTVDFDPGYEEDLHTTNGLFSDIDTYLVKYTQDGNYQWVGTWGGYNHDYPFTDKGLDVVVDNWDNIYVTGHYDGANVDFDPGPGYNIQSSRGFHDVFLSKFNHYGDFQWARTWGSSYNPATGSCDHGESVSVDEAGYVYVAGYFQDGCDFDPGPNHDWRVTHGFGDSDAFLSKFDTNGMW